MRFFYLIEDFFAILSWSLRVIVPETLEEVFKEVSEEYLQEGIPASFIRIIT